MLGCFFKVCFCMMLFVCSNFSFGCCFLAENKMGCFFEGAFDDFVMKNSVVKKYGGLSPYFGYVFSMRDDYPFSQNRHFDVYMLSQQAEGYSGEKPEEGGKPEDGEDHNAPTGSAISNPETRQAPSGRVIRCSGSGGFFGVEKRDVYDVVVNKIAGSLLLKSVAGLDRKKLCNGKGEGLRRGMDYWDMVLYTNKKRFEMKAGDSIRVYFHKSENNTYFSFNIPISNQVLYSLLHTSLSALALKSSLLLGQPLYPARHLANTFAMFIPFSEGYDMGDSIIIVAGDEVVFAYVPTPVFDSFTEKRLHKDGPGKRDPDDGASGSSQQLAY